MDWKNDLPGLTGIDRFIADGAQRLMRGPVTFRSPYWEGDVVIETLEGYRAWVRTIERVNGKPQEEQRAMKVWEAEIGMLQRGEYEYC